MRRRKKFSDRPKRTHEERRKATEPEWLKDLGEMFGVNHEVYVLAMTRYGAAVSSHGFERRASLSPWMKRSEYLRAYDQEIRRGKWRQRQERGREKRRWKARMKWVGEMARVMRVASWRIDADQSMVRIMR